MKTKYGFTKNVILNLFQDCNSERPCDPESSSGRRARFGFTLAEVLITLGIIGIVAAMTIPTLMNKSQDNQFKVAYKKAYSSASQAWLQAHGNGDLTLCPSWTDGACNKLNFTAFKNQMKVIKECNNSDTANCWDMTGEKTWGNNYPTADASAFIDANGVAWSQITNTATTGPDTLIDTNGPKGPNKYGKDRAVINLLFLADMVNRPTLIATPKAELMRDCDGVVPADYPTWTVTQQSNRCPSYATSPCYYTSWITGSK